MALFKKKKKKDNEEFEGYSNRELKKASQSKVLVKVFKDFGNDTAFLKAKYTADEKRDQYNNLVQINEDLKHNEDVDFSDDDVYRQLEIILDFRNLDKQKKVELLEKKIRFQEKLIIYLNKIVELNAIYNYADENIKLRDYRVLLSKIKNHGTKGSYFTIEEGLRTYYFNSIDGFLVPIWWNKDDYTTHPGHPRKKKITNQDDLRFAKEIAQVKLDSKMVTAGLWMLVIGIILIGIAIFGLFKSYGVYKDAKEVIDGNAISCMEYTSMLNKEYGVLVQDVIRQGQLYQEVKAGKTEPLKKEPPKKEENSLIKDLPFP